MAETRTLLTNMPSNLLGEANCMVPMEYKNMSVFVVEATKHFIEEKKKLEIVEKLIKGYKEMSELNLRLCEMGLDQDIHELALYELSLRRCDLL